MKSFCDRVLLLDKGTSEKLCVTNDEKPSLFSITDLLSGIYYESGIPLCFRSLPHQFNAGGLSIREALFLASSTWKSGERPFFIHGESSDIDAHGISLSPIPTNKLTRRIPTFGLDCDIIIDSPGRELTYIDYIKNISLDDIDEFIMQTSKISESISEYDDIVNSPFILPFGSPK